jgi:hypothetical protein
MDFDRRYSRVADDPQPMEIVLLMGRGCFWKRCTFCDYHQDSGADALSIPLNDRVLDCVTGEFGRLVALNSGSWFELPAVTRKRVIDLCVQKKIGHLHMESHWRLAPSVMRLKETLAEQGIALHARIGIETFDEDFREDVMCKGMGRDVSPEAIAAVFDECCLLFGMEGQSAAQFEKDLAIARRWFSRVYVNIYNANSTAVQADEGLIDWFAGSLYPSIKNDPQLCVLMANTELGVGD